MRELENLTKNELKTIIREQEKRLEGYYSSKNDTEELRNELNLYKHLKEEYVPTFEENKRLFENKLLMERRIQDLQDLCDRQQKIIDGRYD